MIFLFTALAQAEILINVDWTPIQREDLFLSQDDSIHPLSTTARTGIQPWVGWSNKVWSTMATFDYSVTEVRTYSGEDIDVQNIGTFHLAAHP